MEEEAGGDDVDAPLAVHLRVGDTLPVVLAHRVRPPLGVRLAEGPERLAGRGVHRHDGPPVAGHAKELAFGVDRRGAHDRIDVRPEVVTAPDPGHLEMLEVAAVDLVERGIAGAPLVGPPVSPAAVLRRRGRRSHDQRHRDQRRRNHSKT